MEWVSSVVLSQAHLEFTSTFESVKHLTLLDTLEVTIIPLFPKPESTRMENQRTGAH